MDEELQKTEPKIRKKIEVSKIIYYSEGKIQPEKRQSFSDWSFSTEDPSLSCIPKTIEPQNIAITFPYNEKYKSITENERIREKFREEKRKNFIEKMFKQLRKTFS